MFGCISIVYIGNDITFFVPILSSSQISSFEKGDIQVEYKRKKFYINFEW